jgi:hypothetical protein
MRGESRGRCHKQLPVAGFMSLVPHPRESRCNADACLGEDVIRRVLRDGRVLEGQGAVARPPNDRKVRRDRFGIYLSLNTDIYTAACAVRGVLGEDAVVDGERVNGAGNASPKKPSNPETRLETQSGTLPTEHQPMPSVADAWTGWRHVYLEHVVKTGATFRALARAGVTPRQLQDAIDQDGDFAEAIERAKGEHGDDLAEGLVETRFPVGRIVRLKALRPQEYIEKHAVLNLNADLNELPLRDAVAVLRGMMTHITPSTRRMLDAGAPPEDAPKPETA